MSISNSKALSSVVDYSGVTTSSSKHFYDYTTGTYPVIYGTLNSNQLSLSNDEVKKNHWISTLENETTQVDNDAAQVSEYAALLLMLRGSIENVQSNGGYVFSNCQTVAPNKTAGSFKSGLMQSWEVKALKQGLLMQLSNHPLKPMTYNEGDDASIVEFHKHKSHLVYVVDSEGVQFMWIQDDKPHSQYIPDHAISFTKISNNVAQLMSCPE